MHEVEALQVLHARGHLGGHVEEGGEAEGLGVGDHVGSVLGQVRLEELGEVPVVQVLHHYFSARCSVLYSLKYHLSEAHGS